MLTLRGSVFRRSLGPAAILNAACARFAVRAANWSGRRMQWPQPEISLPQTLIALGGVAAPGRAAGLGRLSLRLVGGGVRPSAPSAASGMAARVGRLPLVAIDLDEVLGKTIPAIAKWHNAHFGSSITQADFKTYNYWETWGGTREQAIEKVKLFYTSEQFREIEPMDGAKEVLNSLRTFCRLVVVTSRQSYIEAATREFLARHYPGTFEDCHFGNHFLPAGHEAHGFVTRTKQDICRSIGAVALVDDSLDYAKDVAAGGMHALLFDHLGAYGWNAVPNQTLPPLVQRVTSWPEVAKKLREILASVA